MAPRRRGTMTDAILAALPAPSGRPLLVLDLDGVLNLFGAYTASTTVIVSTDGHEVRRLHFTPAAAPLLDAVTVAGHIDDVRSRKHSRLGLRSSVATTPGLSAAIVDGTVAATTETLVRTADGQKFVHHLPRGRRRRSARPGGIRRRRVRLVDQPGARTLGRSSSRPSAAVSPAGTSSRKSPRSSAATATPTGSVTRSRTASPSSEPGGCGRTTRRSRAPALTGPSTTTPSPESLAWRSGQMRASG